MQKSKDKVSIAAYVLAELPRWWEVLQWERRDTFRISMLRLRYPPLLRVAVSFEGQEKRNGKNDDS